MPRIKENFQAKLTVLREQAQDPIWNLDNLDTALSLASFYGPASIPAALGSMAIHVAQGRWEEIPWDVVGAVPEVGPTIKAARRAQKIADIADGLSDAKRAAKRSEEPAAQKPNTQEPPVKPKEQETVEQKRKREEEETAARKKKKNDEAWARIRNSRDSFNPNQYGSGTGDQQAAATGLDQRPQTGFINPIAGIAPTRTDVNTTLAARVAAARRAALSEQTLRGLRAPTKLQKFLRRIFTNKKGDLDIGNFVGNRGGSSGGDGFQYKKQRPQTGFRNPLESQNPFARARQGNPYDIYDVLSRQMTQANLAFMRSSIKEDTVLPKLYTMIQENVDTKNINIGNDSVLVTKNMADNIIKLFEAINDSNKVKLNKMLNESTDNFYKVLDFAVRH